MLSVAKPTPSHPRFLEISLDFVCPALQQMLRDKNSDIEQCVKEMTRECNVVMGVAREPPAASWWWIAPQAVVIALLVALAIRVMSRRGRAEAPAGGGGPLGRENVVLLGFISPWVVGFLLLVAGPMVFSLCMAQTDYEVGSRAHYVGLANFKNLLTVEPEFWPSLRRTATFAAVSVPLKLAVALAAAMLLNIAFVRGIGIFRTIFFLPSLLPVAASTLMWMFLMDKRRGMFNRVLDTVGIEGQGWFTDPRLALWTLIFVSMWAFGGAMLIFLAGLQDVPRSLHEAAMIDGAGPWDRFRHVTIPAISPVIFFNMVMGVIGAMQIFAVAYILGGAGGGAGKALYFYVLVLFKHAFMNLRMGIGSAMAWILFCLIVTLTALNFALSKRWVHYRS